ncbi:MAG: amino acid ABC transporter ATP-binding protein [Actinomycetota bacterium]|nr:amino acid ABC transporter ATP-binding protein [Actinomycetota bacterium]
MNVTAPAKVELRRVTKAFGERVVLEGFDLAVDDGEVVCLIGASGSGKTTVLRCINLLEPIDDGEIFLDGNDIAMPGLDADPIRQRIGMVFQQFNLFPHRSVLDNVTLAPRKVLGRGKAESAAAATELLARFGLGDKAGAYPDQLSGGQQQRVAIVRALAMHPEVMLLDEITSSLDPELVGEVLDVVRELKREGLTMLFATHEMAFAREIADRVCFLHDGALLESGTPAELFDRPQHERTRQFLARVTKVIAGGAPAMQAEGLE